MNVIVLIKLFITGIFFIMLYEYLIIIYHGHVGIFNLNNNFIPHGYCN